MDYDVDDAGRVTEIPPAMLVCGHPNGPRRALVGYDWSETEQRRVRTYRCRQCAAVTFWP